MFFLFHLASLSCFSKQGAVFASNKYSDKWLEEGRLQMKANRVEWKVVIYQVDKPAPIILIAPYSQIIENRAMNFYL
jgi:hypothetical protein